MHLYSPELTFIVLARDQDVKQDDLAALLSRSPMAGDVNVFFNQVYDDDDDDDKDAAPLTYGEMEVMIAEPRFRRKGLADEALRMLLYYITTTPTPAPDAAPAEAQVLPLPPTRLMVRIGSANDASLALFQRLGFAKFKENAVFQETELRVQDSEALQRTAPRAVLAWPEAD